LLLTSTNPVGKFWNKHLPKLIIGMRAGHCSDEATRRGPCDYPREKICIQKGFDNTKVVYG